MAAQICRPCTNVVVARSSSSRVSQRQHFNSPFLRVQRPGSSSSSASNRLEKCCSSSKRISAVAPSASANSGRSDQEHRQKEQRLSQVLKLVAPLVSGLLLCCGPALATTVAVTAAGSAARGFRVPELIASAWTGLMAGCLHTLTGPDHLAALAPLSIGRTKMEGAVVGALWGCGHDAGQIIFGLLFLLLKDRLHFDLVRTWSARVVGVTLLAIGAIGIKEAQEVPVPCLAGEECEAEYQQVEAGSGRKKPFGLATFATGIVHGLQPDALLVILPALALPSRVAGVSFLFMFLVGTVVAMASYTAFVGSCSEALQKRVPWITQRLSWGSSLIAIAVGVSILLGEVFGINLF